jgi:hypothetical protein
MATDTNIKNALTFPERSDNLIYSQGKTIDAAAFQRLLDYLKGNYDYPDGGDWPVGRPDANDAAAWLWHWASTTIKQSEKAAAELAAVVEPAEFGT